MSEQTLEQIRIMLLNEIINLPSEKIYFTLKKLRVKPIHAQTVETMKICLALHNRGLPVTRYLVAWLRYNDPFLKRSTAIINALHVLGDKKVLSLYRGSKSKQSRWVISDLFKDAYEGKENEHRDS